MTPAEQAARDIVDRCDVVLYAERVQIIAQAIEQARRGAPDPIWQELYDAAFDFGTYDDLYGDLCDHCKPTEPASFIAARKRLADAIAAIRARGEER